MGLKKNTLEWSHILHDHYKWLIFFLPHSELFLLNYHAFIGAESLDEKQTEPLVCYL